MLVNNQVSDQHDITTWFKVAIAWVGTLAGSITGQEAVLFLTGVFTALQIYVLLRDKVFNRKKE